MSSLSSVVTTRVGFSATSLASLVIESSACGYRCAPDKASIRTKRAHRRDLDDSPGGSEDPPLRLPALHQLRAPLRGVVEDLVHDVGRSADRRAARSAARSAHRARGRCRRHWRRRCRATRWPGSRRAACCRSGRGRRSAGRRSTRRCPTTSISALAASCGRWLTIRHHADRASRRPSSSAWRRGRGRSRRACRERQAGRTTSAVTGVKIHGLPRNRSGRAKPKPPRSAPPIG